MSIKNKAKNTILINEKAGKAVIYFVGGENTWDILGFAHQTIQFLFVDVKKDLI